MTVLARDIGIPVPTYQMCEMEYRYYRCEIPVLFIKPSHQRPGHYNEFKFKLCKSRKELEKTLKYVHHDSVFIIQEYIPKEKDVLVYGGRMMDGKTVLAGAIIRDRFDQRGSTSHGLITANIPGCVDTKKIEQFLEKIDYYGLFSFEYGMVKDRGLFLRGQFEK